MLQEANHNRRAAKAQSPQSDCPGHEELDFFIKRARMAEQASEFLTRKAPNLSAKTVFSGSQRLFILLAVICIAIAAIHAPDASMFALMALLYLLFFSHLMLKIAATIHSLFRRSDHRKNSGAQVGDDWKRVRRRRLSISDAGQHHAENRQDEQDLPIYSVMVPLYKEAAVLPQLIAALKAIDYPRHLLDVKLLLEEDDLETMVAAQEICADGWPEILIVPGIGPGTKPKAMNYGLAYARGEFVCIYDAEDRPDPKQILAALDTFATEGPDLAVVQAPLRIYNADQSWISRQFELEYLVQFGVILPFLAWLRLPVPLGGTSNHFRVGALREIGGWDPYNVTEDADIGLRLTQFGYRCAVVEYPTFEEAPVSIKQWMNQRSRWIKGYLQTWLVMMRNPLRFIRRCGLLCFIGFHLSFGVGLLTSFLYGICMLWILFALVFGNGEIPLFHLLLVIFGYLSNCCACLTQLQRRPAGGRNIAKRLLALLVSPMIYQSQQFLAGIIAVMELITSPHSWNKTPHGLAAVADK